MLRPLSPPASSGSSPWTLKDEMEAIESSKTGGWIGDGGGSGGGGGRLEVSRDETETRKEGNEEVEGEKLRATRRR